MSTPTLTAALQETLDGFDEAGTPLTTSEVADRLDLGRRSTYERLDRLTEADRLRSKKVGASARVWWRPPDDTAAGSGPEQFDSFVDAVDEYAIFRLDADGRVQSWNAGAERLKGYTADDVLGESFSMFYTDEDQAEGVPGENLERAVDAGTIEREGWRRRKDGTRFWANVTIQAVTTGGEHTGFIKITKDMTGRRERERQLRRERDLTHELLETAPVRLGVYRGDGTLERVNSLSRQRVGLDDESIPEFDISDLEFYDADGEPLSPADHPVPQVIETGEPAKTVVQHDDPEGRHHWVRLSASPVVGDDGDIERVVIAGEEFTDLKRQEAQLERRRDELSAELDEMFDRIDEAFFAVDDDWRFTYVNEQAENALERSAGELMGQRIWNQFPEAAESRFQREYERARETQESVTFEAYFDPVETWFEVSAYPSENGLSVYFQDITDRKRREEELERYETIVETMSDGVYVVDDTRTITMANESYAEMLGYEPSEVLGMDVSEIVDGEVAQEAVRLHGELASGERETARLEAELTTSQGKTITAEATFALIDTGTDSQERIGVVRDVTQRRARERRLEHYETIVETIEDGIYAVDESGHFTMVNEGFCRLTGFERAALVGAHASKVQDDDITAEAEAQAREMADGDRDVGSVQVDIVTSDGDTVPCETRFSLLESAPDRGRCGVVRDISDRLEQERELERRLTQQEVVAELGQRALTDHDIDTLMAEATRQVADVLGTDYCKVLELNQSGATLLLRQGVGWSEGLVGTTEISAVDDESQAAYTLETTGPVVVEDLATEDRFSGPDLLTDNGVRSGISTVIGSASEPWGVLGTHATDVRSLSETDVTFVQSVSNVLASAIKRRDDETRLRHQRELLSALNSINAVVRETTKAVIEQPTRDEIERVVCENLAETDSYAFAWVGEADADSDAVNVRTAAGTQGYLDDITVTTDPDDPHGLGPTGRALREAEPQVARNLADNERHEPWDERAAAAGVAASVAIPIAHDGSVYGVLNVYSARAEAFDAAELAVVGQLGEVVGHAIAATERKRALTSDEVVELEFVVHDMFEDVAGVTAPSGTVHIDQVVPVDDGNYIIYGTASDEAAAAFPDLVEAMPNWSSATLRAADDGSNFELNVSDPPILSTLAEAGGLVDSATLEDGTYHLTVHLSPNTEVRRVTDAVRAAYPSASLLRRRQRTRRKGGAVAVQQTVDEELTDRQRTVLTAAFHAGFFEWPRDVTGEDLAASLDVSPPTVHQHLRKAQRKVFAALFS